MIDVDFSGVMADVLGSEHGVTSDDLERISGKSLNPSFPFLTLLHGQERVINEIQRTAEAVKRRFQNLVVLGIGGSSLGLRTIAQALLRPYGNLLGSQERRGFPRMFVCDNIDPDHFGALLKFLDWKETCVNVISKSGNTIETASQFFIVKDILTKKLGASQWKEHVIITTDPVNGPFRAMAKADDLQNFAVPENIGGRYSVLSPVGLLPAACVGIDIKELLAGASEMANQCSSPDLDKNTAFKNGAIHYLMDTIKHKPISVMMPYSDSLSLFADWYAQLWAESLGKNGGGPTPVKALGATDQHSQLQLYMDGPNDKVVTFIGVKKFNTKLSVPGDVPKDFSHIGKCSMDQILHAEQKATEAALLKNHRPTVKITLPELSARNIGRLLMMYQIQTAFTGHLYGVNPYDQPGVELGKRLTREYLKN